MGLFALVSVLLTASGAGRLAFYADADHDGYGDPSAIRYATVRPPGYTRHGGDCDDADIRVHPGAVEVCNDRDDDCDGLDDLHDTDVVGGPTWYADMDDDGFGNPRAWMRSCVEPRGFVDVARDCNDRDDMANPLAFEFCSDGDDDDCNGRVDDCDVSLDDAALVVTSRTPRTSAQGRLAVADMDGDGTGDLLVGSDGPPLEAAVYLVYGPASGTVFVDDAVTISTTSKGDWFGSTIGGGDADADGFDDLLVGAPVENPAVYLFLGPVTADRNVRDADAVLMKAGRDAWGGALLVAADHDGDGDADVVAASVLDGEYGDEGAVYVAPGATTRRFSLDADATYIYEGQIGDWLGAKVADLGDVNGDGIDELAMSEWYGGEICLVEGGLPPGRYGAADVAATIIGGMRNWGGFQAVDYDGDGAMDLIAGDYGARSSTGEYSGGVYAFVAPWAAAMDVDDATAKWEWTAATSATILGGTLAASDFDGDGETDLVIGAYGNYDGNDSGAAFFQWGVTSGVVDVGSLPYVTGSFDGARLGIEMAALPDWNGDGIPEVAIQASFGADYSDGAIYGFFSGSY